MGAGQVGYLSDTFNEPDMSRSGPELHAIAAEAYRRALAFNETTSSYRKEDREQLDKRNSERGHGNV